MSTISTAMTFSAKERECELLFCQYGPFFHMYTDGNLSQTLFCNQEDFIVIMNLIGSCSCFFDKIDIYTYEIMNNHLHFIVGGDKTEAEQYFYMLKSRLQRYYIRSGRCIDLRNFNCEFITIDSLLMLRNEIGYTNRNGYVVRPDCTPYSYPWGAGALFFNPFLKLIPSKKFSELPIKEKRRICHSHNIPFKSDNLLVYNGIILPSSYCKIKVAEKMFRDAHHYFHLISKNFEAFSEIAKRLHEKVIISDEEMYAAVSNIAFKEFGIKQPSLLTAKGKIDVAKRMHYDFNASNRQIKNILKIESNIIDELFPQ